MSYPAYGIRTSPRVTLQDDVRLTRSSNGTLRSRQMWPAPMREFAISHVLSADDLDDYRTFYETNRGQTFDFVWPVDGATYTVMFAEPPSERHYGGAWWEVTAKLVESA